MTFYIKRFYNPGYKYVTLKKLFQKYFLKHENKDVNLLFDFAVISALGWVHGRLCQMRTTTGNFFCRKLFFFLYPPPFPPYANEPRRKLHYVAECRSRGKNLSVEWNSELHLLLKAMNCDTDSATHPTFWRRWISRFNNNWFAQIQGFILLLASEFLF